MSESDSGGRRVSPAFRSMLRRELDDWVSEGVVDTDQSAISRRYGLDDVAGRSGGLLVRRSWRLWSPRPGFISCATTGSWPPVPATAAASCRPSRLPSRRRRTAIRALRPAPIAWGGGPAGPGVGRRPQRMRDLWRAPEDQSSRQRPTYGKCFCRASHSYPQGRGGLSQRVSVLPGGR